MSANGFTPVSGFRGSAPIEIFGERGGEACERWMDGMLEQGLVGSKTLQHKEPKTPGLSPYHLIIEPPEVKYETRAYSVLPVIGNGITRDEDWPVFICADKRLRVWTPNNKVRNLPLDETGRPVVPILGGYVTSDSNLSGVEIVRF